MQLSYLFYCYKVFLLSKKTLCFLKNYSTQSAVCQFISGIFNVPLPPDLHDPEPLSKPVFLYHLKKESYLQKLRPSI